MEYEYENSFVRKIIYINENDMETKEKGYIIKRKTI